MVGGQAILGAMFLSLLLVTWLAGPQALSTPGSQPIIAILLGALAMNVLGTWDDLSELSSIVKLAVQVTIAVTVFYGGVRLLSVELPFVGLVEFGYASSLFLTVFWLVGITNAFNLVDGADGLAGGAALFATVAMFVVSLVFGQYLAALVLVVTAGAVLGFLHFNFPPASVFLGDSGSLFLGFLLAGLSVAGSTKAATAVAIAIPVVTFGLPVLDTALAVVRRFLRGEKITKADRGHIHHRLRDLGHSPRKVALILYAACGLLGLVSLLFISENGGLIGLGFLVIGLAVSFGVQRLRVPELLEVRQLIDRGIRQRQVISSNLAVREGAKRISETRSLMEAFRELEDALRGSPFDAGELWLTEDYLGSATTELSPEVELLDGGVLWRWRKVPLAEIDPAVCWEVTLPVAPAGEWVGRITLRRRLGEEMPAEVRVVADLLLPEMTRAVDRFERAVEESAVGCEAVAS
jgi:UDP-GlcNAc:undecaprenyl-phosphate GlcNAc-1-phosphate transferase